jgi:enoyl-[acyl-carrier-protein] reductase (NADH)
VNNQALKRRVTSDDTAAAVAVLSSEGAAAMTGQVLGADGGFFLR